MKTMMMVMLTGIESSMPLYDRHDNVLVVTTLGTELLSWHNEVVVEHVALAKQETNVPKENGFVVMIGYPLLGFPLLYLPQSF